MQELHNKFARTSCAMDALLVELTELLQNENEEWKKIYLPLKWKIFQNANSLYVIIDIDIIVDENTGQTIRIYEATIHNQDEMDSTVGHFLETTRTP